MERDITYAHFDMITKLSGFLHHNIDGWHLFLNMLKVYLAPAEVKDINNMGDACMKLMEKNIISFGQYDELIKIFNTIEHIKCVEIVEEFVARIHEIEERHSSKTDTTIRQRNPNKSNTSLCQSNQGTSNTNLSRSILKDYLQHIEIPDKISANKGLVVGVVFAAVAAAVAAVLSFDYVLFSPKKDSPTNIRNIFDDYTTKNIRSKDCKAIGGLCQSDSIKCAGSFISNKCPGHRNIRCCTSSYIIFDTGFCADFGVRIISRDSWGAVTPVSKSQIKTPVNIFLVHHTVTQPCTSISKCISLVKEIQTFHMEDRKMSDIAYNFLVGEDGNVYEGRSWNKEGEHTRGQNKISINAAMIGNFHDRIPNEDALKAVKSLIRCGVSRGMINFSYSLRAHRDFSDTVSPGDALYNNMKSWPNFYKNRTE